MCFLYAYTMSFCPDVSIFYDLTAHLAQSPVIVGRAAPACSPRGTSQQAPSPRIHGATILFSCHFTAESCHSVRHSNPYCVCMALPLADGFLRWCNAPCDLRQCRDWSSGQTPFSVCAGMMLCHRHSPFTKCTGLQCCSRWCFTAGRWHFWKGYDLWLTAYLDHKCLFRE